MAPLATPWPRNFRPNPNNFAAQFQALDVAIGTGGFALTGTATTTVWVPVSRARTLYVYNASFQGPTAAGGSGAITAQLFKLKTDNTAVSLTAATSITATIIGSTTNNSVEWTVTPALAGDNVVSPGENLVWKLVAAGTVATAPVLQSVVEVSVIS
jgi:hypothetical protein